MDRKDWTRIGVAATVLLVPGGFVLGGLLAARRYRAMRATAAGSGDGEGEPNFAPASTANPAEDG